MKRKVCCHSPQTFLRSCFESERLNLEVMKMKLHAKSRSASVIITAGVILLATASASMAQRRRVVVVRHPHPARHALAVRTGHPIHRLLPREVVVRPARRAVVVRAPLRFLPALTWRTAFVTLPPRERIVWQDTQTIARDEEWVDTNYGVDGNGNTLFLDLNGSARLNFAEVTYENGDVQVVDFNEQEQHSGTYRLVDLGAGQHVMTVRILAKSESDDTKLAVYLAQ
jgi:hypothetical protein